MTSVGLVVLLLYCPTYLMGLLVDVIQDDFLWVSPVRVVVGAAVSIEN